MENQNAVNRTQEKINELMKEGKLAETVMADREFVKLAEKIFHEKGIEINREELYEILKLTEDFYSGKMELFLLCF